MRRVACVGGATADCCARLLEPLREGTSNPVATTSGFGGVARNVAEWLATLGCRVSLFSIVGRDPEGDRLLVELQGRGVDVSGIRRSPDRPTAAYTAVLDPDGALALGLAAMTILDELDLAWCDDVSEALREFPMWFLDANLPAETLGRLLEARAAAEWVLADPVSVAKSRRLASLLGSVDVLFPDRLEAAALAGTSAETAAGVASAAARIRELGAGAVVVSLGADGAYVDDGDRQELLAPIPPRRVRDVTGAGDALAAGYAFGLLSEAADPVQWGLGAASLTVESGSSVPPEVSAELLATRLREVPGASPA